MQISLSEASAERRIREFWGWALRDLAEKPALMRYEPARASRAASALLRGPRDDALVMCKHHPAAVDRRGALLMSPHSAPWAKRKGGPGSYGRIGSPLGTLWATPETIVRNDQRPEPWARRCGTGAAPRGSAPEPAPTSAAAAVGQARRDGAPAAAALSARPGASLGSFRRLAGLLSGRSTPKSCTTTLLFRPRSFSGRHADMQAAVGRLSNRIE
mgnify:CR=1 FL=1